MASYVNFYRWTIFSFLLVIQLFNLSLHILAKSENPTIVSKVSYNFLNFFRIKQRKLTDFFYLEIENKKLAKENVLLHQYIANISYIPITLNKNYEIEAANIVNNCNISSKNFITIDKGAAQGIEKGMGVFSAKTIIGRVLETSENFSVVVSILNSSVWIPAEIEGKGIICSVNWSKELNYAEVLIKGLPNHLTIEPGDKVITSGYSDVFPKGLEIGTVHQINISKGGIKEFVVKLGEDPCSVKHVYVVKNILLSEQRNLENSIVDEKE